MGPRAAKSAGRAAAAELPDGEPGAVVRRAPFSDNPKVGARGQQAQQRILAAALQVFGELGYHGAGMSRITEVAGCSRAAVYQYFSGKEDLFRHLAGQVGRQLRASTEALPPITPDADGWEQLRSWIDRHAAIHARYEPVFLAFQAAAESDEAVASGSARIGERNVAALQAKIAARGVPARQVGPVLALLLECITRTHHVARVLRAASPSWAWPESRVDAALADVVHRTLFGLDPAVNVQPPPRRRPPRIPVGPLVVEAAEGPSGGPRPDTRATLMDAGHDVLVTRGYHGTRVDDIVAAAGLSHGAFYRYFDNKEHFIRLLAARAMRKVSVAFAAIPEVTVDGTADGALRRWLRQYNTTHASEAAMIRVWVDATAYDPGLRAESAGALDWGRERLVRFLSPRGFGDADTEALVMVALLDAFGARRREPATVAAAATIIERGLLSAPGRAAP